MSESQKTDATEQNASAALNTSPAELFAQSYSIGDLDTAADVVAAQPGPAAAAPEPAVASDATPKATDAPPATGKHPKWLADQVADLGLHESVLALDTESLGTLVADQNRKLRAEYAEQRRAAAHDQATPAQPVQSKPTVTETPSLDWGEVEDQDEDGRTIKRKVREDELHPSIVHVMKAQAEQIRRLEAVIAQGVQTATQTREQTFHNQLDTSFSRHPNVFGSGSAADVRGKPEFRRRKAVLEELRQMPEEARAGKSLDQLIDLVAADLFGPMQTSAPAADGGAQKEAVAKWNSGAVARPTQRANSDKAPGRARAVDAVRQFLKETAADAENPLASDVTLDEFLPG